jgi:NAD(P)-dependent dehydrogenase (short-subunit alcohol dehydrogenase family)
MLERGEGYVLHTASMAGILTSPGAPAYAATKHAVVGLAEWLSVTYGHRGIRVFLLCPLGIDTPMLAHTPPALRAASGGVRTADEVAQNVIDGFEREELLILTDPNAAEWIGRKSNDLERWLEGMRRVQDKF